MLKVIKNLSSASNTLETLDSVGTIELLADFLITNAKSAHYKVMVFQYGINNRKYQIKFSARYSISVDSINHDKKRQQRQEWSLFSSK